MDVEINHQLFFTQEALAEIDGRPVTANPFPVGNGIPHPMVGDWIELLVKTQPTPFQVVRREFRYRTKSLMEIHYWLDVAYRASSSDEPVN